MLMNMTIFVMKYVISAKKQELLNTRDIMHVKIVSSVENLLMLDMFMTTNAISIATFVRLIDLQNMFIAMQMILIVTSVEKQDKYKIK